MAGDSKIKKKLEALKKLQETSEIIEKGGVQDQALQGAADDQWPAVASRLDELVEKSKIKKAPGLEELIVKASKKNKAKHKAKAKARQASKKARSKR